MQLLREAPSSEIFTAQLSLNQPGLFAASTGTAPVYKWLPARFLSKKLGVSMEISPFCIHALLKASIRRAGNAGAMSRQNEF